MPYSLTVGYWHFLPATTATVAEPCNCEEARKGCSPTYVFSFAGQLKFRQSLHHLAHCSSQNCSALRRKVLKGMHHKLEWLLAEESILGCIHAQPYLYGSKRVILNHQQFSAAAQHLASCPKDSCAQLRRALLLSVREFVRPIPTPVPALDSGAH